jgi:hypothetical protein
MGEAKRRKKLDKNFGKSSVKELIIISNESFLGNHKTKLENDSSFSQKDLNDFLFATNLICFRFKDQNKEKAGMYIFYENLKNLFQNKQKYLSVEGNYLKLNLESDMVFNQTISSRPVEEKIFYKIEHVISNLIYLCNSAEEFAEAKSNLINQEINLDHWGEK